MDIKQKYNTLLIIAHDNTPYNGHTLAHAYQERYNETINWHEFSTYLDWLNCNGIVRQTATTRDGMAVYVLNN